MHLYGAETHLQCVDATDASALCTDTSAQCADALDASSLCINASAQCTYKYIHALSLVHSVTMQHYITADWSMLTDACAVLQQFAKSHCLYSIGILIMGPCFVMHTYRLLLAYCRLMHSVLCILCTAYCASVHSADVSAVCMRAYTVYLIHPVQ